MKQRIIQVTLTVAALIAILIAGGAGGYRRH